MLSKFKRYYQNNNLFEPEDKILLTVSAGRDSVSMVYFFLQSKLNFGIAHCNFKLRGDEADRDEQFVKELANQFEIPFYSVPFDTENYSNEKGISIQMAARELRYNWFEEIRGNYGYDYIATAHHKNDIAETMLINLTKGTGIAGLHGILSKKDKIVRPLLDFTREDIDIFLKKNNINFREDQSNSDTKYIRNKIRHNVITELEKINPNLIETLNTESQQFFELEQILGQKIEEERENCFTKENDFVKIEIEKLLKLSPLKTYLYLFIKEFGFSITNVQNIMECLKNQSGKTFYSSKYLLVKDRDYLILKELTKEGKSYIEIASVNEFKKSPVQFSVKQIEIDGQFKIEKSIDSAFLDFDKIVFPLTIRRWREGDVFQPIGLKGRKKVSDFFIDKKLSIIEKESVWILENKEQIVWIIGYRISDYFKITESTTRVLSLKIV